MNKHNTQLRIEKLKPLPIPNSLFQSISIDFMTGFFKVGEYDAITVIVCQLSKWIAFISIKKTVKANEIVVLFFDN